MSDIILIMIILITLVLFVYMIQCIVEDTRRIIKWLGRRERGGQSE